MRLEVFADVLAQRGLSPTVCSVTALPLWYVLVRLMFRWPSWQTSYHDPH